MSRSELAERHRRLQRKLAASYHHGWHSGRVDQLEEALRSIEQEMGKFRGVETTADRPAARQH